MQIKRKNTKEKQERKKLKQNGEKKRNIKLKGKYK